MLTIIGIYLLIALAAARLTVLIVHDEITRPIREWIWLRSAPEGATIREIGENGDTERPARMYHWFGAVDGVEINKHGFDATQPMRAPGFFGKLIECPYCTSFWVALALFLLHEIWFKSVFRIDAPLAVWAVANAFAVKAL